MVCGLFVGWIGMVGFFMSDFEGCFMILIFMGVEDVFGVGCINVFLCDVCGDVIWE